MRILHVRMSAIDPAHGDAGACGQTEVAASVWHSPDMIKEVYR